MSAKKKFSMFTMIVLSLSFLLWGSLALFQFKVPNLASSEDVQIFPMMIYIINGFVPSILGVILYLLTEKNTWKKDLKTVVPSKKYLAMYGKILVLFVTIIFTQFMLFHFFVEDFDFSVIPAQASQLLPLIILGPLSEEIGWRGYLEKQADGFISKRNKPVIIGFIWALWHLPLFYILGTTQQVNQMNFMTFMILIILLSIIMSYYREKTNHAIFTAILIHYLYTVGLTFYILGSTYSFTSDLLSMIPFILAGGYFLFRLSVKKK